MSSAALTYPVWRKWRNALRTVFVVCGIATAATVLILAGGASSNFLFFLLACAIFVGSLYLARALSGTALASDRQSFLLSNLVIWVFLMVSEAIFTHIQTTQDAAKGNVGSNALYQAASWILCFLALVFITCFRPAYLRRLFSGPLKWPSLFAVVAVISCPLSQKPLYSFALAFKVGIIVLTVCAIAEATADGAGIFRFYAALFVGMLITVTMELLAPLAGPGPIFQSDGRLGLMIGLSGTCGILLLLCVLFLIMTRNLFFLLCGLYSLIVMMLAGTKGGMVASFVSLMMFFVLLKKPAQALGASLVFTVIFVLAFVFTPLGRSLEKYSESGTATTLTGRTDRWTVT